MQLAQRQSQQSEMQELKIKQITDSLSFSRAEKLGQGSFGQVFLGFNEQRKQPCAFKIINLQKVSAQGNAQSLMKKIKDEIVNMQLAHHPSIIEFQQAKQSANNIYILCEYCNGESLASYIEKRQYLTQHEALVFFKEILQGFIHLRKNNIVHRDLKPANLLLHNFGIKIGDLGFSKVTEDHQQMLESMVGTPLYMSPQIFEREKYTQKTDIWSLGVILYEMLYGRNPYANCKNLYDLKEKIKREVVFPKYPIVSSSLKTTIRHMLVVPERDRISWEHLFQQYLLPAPVLAQPSSCLPSEAALDYFRSSLFLQSRLQLPKLAELFSLFSQQERLSLSCKHSSSQQFYTEILFLSQNKQLIADYYNSYFKRRNEVSFMILLVEKALLLTQEVSVQCSVYCYCLGLLGYRYCLALLEELALNQEQLVLLENRFAPVAGRFGEDRILLVLLRKDVEVIRLEYQRFLPYFHAMLSGIQAHHVSSLIQKELSGIYSNEQSQKRVIRFFTTNYMKKIYNILKTTIERPHDMISEEDEGKGEKEGREGEGGVPPLSVTLARMIGEYLNNDALFKVEREKGSQNLLQHMYEWETTSEEQVYEQIQKSERMLEESINSFLSRELVWSQMLLPQLNRPSLH